MRLFWLIECTKSAPDDSRIHFFNDLMELPFYGFDIILGMDLLTKQKAKIDFAFKRVTCELMKGRKSLWLVTEPNFFPTWSR